MEMTKDICRKNVPDRRNGQECVLFEEYQGSWWKQCEGEGPRMESDGAVDDSL